MGFETGFEPFDSGDGPLHGKTSGKLPGVFVLALSWHMVVSSPQYGESTDVFLQFSVDGLHTWDKLLVIP